MKGKIIVIDERNEETKWNIYQEKTLNRKPNKLLLQTLKYFDGFTGYAIDLGCGAGNDTMELLRKGWEVLAIDNNLYGLNKITTELDKQQLAKLETKKECFEKLILPKADLINANYSIPFCNPQYFDRFWTTIVDSININGRFSGNFFGDRDEWINDKNITFLNNKDVIELFNGFNIEHFEEREYNGKTAFDNLKHWHLFNVIARK